MSFQDFLAIRKSICFQHFSSEHQSHFLDPLSADPTKWSNTLKQFVSNSNNNVLIELIDKTYPSDPKKKEKYWMRTLTL